MFGEGLKLLLPLRGRKVYQVSPLLSVALPRGSENNPCSYTASILTRKSPHTWSVLNQLMLVNSTWTAKGTTGGKAGAAGGKEKLGHRANCRA